MFIELGNTNHLRKLMVAWLIENYHILTLQSKAYVGLIDVAA
jgi:hypothetical protein